MTTIVIYGRKFWHRRADGALVPVKAPTSSGLAMQTFGSTGANRSERQRGRGGRS